MAYGYQTGAYFLILDHIPEHVRKTFGLTPIGNFEAAPPAGVIGIIKTGEKIPDNLNFAVIIYHTSTWHLGEAHKLMSQLLQLNPRMQVVSIPVGG